MKRFLTISPREGSELRAATSATSGTGSSCHFAAATSTKRKFDNANYDREKRRRTFQDQWFGEFACYAQINSGKIPCTNMRRAHATLPASITSATSTAKESLGLPLQLPLAVVSWLYMRNTARG